MPRPISAASVRASHSLTVGPSERGALILERKETLPAFASRARRTKIMQQRVKMFTFVTGHGEALMAFRLLPSV